MDDYSFLDTKLSPEQERGYLVWKGMYAPKDSGSDYDLRGAFQEGFKPDSNGHWPDKYKKPNHPTFSDESKYAKSYPRLAGHWQGEDFTPPMSDYNVEITDNFSPVQNPYEDRITAILQKRSQPAPQMISPQEFDAYGVGNIASRQGPQNFLDTIQKLQSSREDRYSQQQDRELQGAQTLYNLFEEKRARGDKQSQALFDRISLFTGGDPEGTAMFLNELHADPESIDPGNAYQVMTKLAGIAKKTGYVSPESQLKKLELSKTKAEINKLNNSGKSDVPADVQSFEYFQKLNSDAKKSFMELKGKGSGLKPTEMKEIFQQDDVINSASDSLSILDQMEALNNMPTYEGPMASQRAYVGSLAGSDEANNTLELENLGKNLAASMLKTTFTGSISNAEREFLQDLQANASKTKAQRQRVLNNGKKLIAARQGRAQEKQRRIQTGEYQTTPESSSVVPLGDDLLEYMTPEEKALFGK